MDECFKPFKTAVHCDNCDEWVELAPKPKPAPLPDQPLF